MDDLQLKVSSPDRYIVRRNGALDLDPVVRRIRDLTMFVTWTERERTIPRLSLFGEWLQSQASDWMSGGPESTCRISRWFRRRSRKWVRSRKQQKKRSWNAIKINRKLGIYWQSSCHDDLYERAVFLMHSSWLEKVFFYFILQLRMSLRPPAPFLNTFFLLRPYL